MKKQLALLALAVLAAPASAQLEKVAVKSTNDFEARLRFLKPAGDGSASDEMPFSVAPFALSGKNGQGGAGGVDFGIPLNNAGSSLMVGVSGFGTSKEYHADGLKKQDRFNGGPTVGYRQYLFRLGVGDKQGGQGAFIEPHLGAGFAPFSASRQWIRNNEDDGWDGHGGYDRWAVLTGYLSAGANVRFNNKFSAGVETRRYADLITPSSSFQATGFVLTFYPSQY